MKNYEQWHCQKTSIENNLKNRLFFQEREIWWCSIGANIGFEQDGPGKRFSRPVLVFKKFNNEIFWSIPISTKIKIGRYYEPVFLADEISRIAILSQLRLVDSKRLLNKIGVINSDNYLKIQKAVINICSL